MSWWTLGFQSINFLVLVWLLQYFLYQPAREMIQRRKAEIDRAYNEAAAAKASADSERRLLEAQRAEAAQAAAKLLNETKEASARERNSILEQARADADNIAAAARDRIARERQDAERQLRERVARLAVEVAAALMRQSLPDDGATPVLADRALRMLERMPRQDRQRMAADLVDGATVELASAAPLAAAQADALRERIAAALEREVPVRFTQDPDLIAGIELRLPHAVLNCSWKQGLAQALNQILEAGGETDRRA